MQKKRQIPFDIEATDPDFCAIYEICKQETITSAERMYALYKSVEYLVRSNIKGDIVECGVWKGGSMKLIALSLIHFNDTDRKLYLYDTYNGMTEPKTEDVYVSHTEVSALTKWKKLKKEDGNEWCNVSLEEVQNVLRTTGYPKEQIIFVKGEVEKTIPNTMPESIALLRLDTDWYESTKHELVHLYPRLNKNGVLIIDDYGHWRGSKQAVDEYFESSPLFLSRIDASGRIAIKP